MSGMIHVTDTPEHVFNSFNISPFHQVDFVREAEDPTFHILSQLVDQVQSPLEQLFE